MIPVREDIVRGLLDGTMSPEDARKWLALHEARDPETLDAIEAQIRERTIIDTAARVSVMPQFQHVESPLVLDIVRAAIDVIDPVTV